MTSNFRSFVNTSCVNINEYYQSYPYVNTNLLTSRSHKGVDRPDGLDNKKSISGRATVSLYPQLGKHHSGPMGPASDKRVFLRAYPNSTSNKTAAGNKLLSRGACQNNTGSLRPPAKGCNSRSPDLHRKLRLPTISSGEERGGDRGQ